MATKRSRIPRYGTVEIKGHIYYKTYVMDADGKQVALYGKTREELYDKELAGIGTNRQCHIPAQIPHS